MEQQPADQAPEVRVTPVNPPEEVIDAVPLTAEELAMADLVDAAAEEEYFLGPLRKRRFEQAPMDGGGYALYGPQTETEEWAATQLEIKRRLKQLETYRRSQLTDPAEIAAVPETLDARRRAAVRSKRETIIALTVFGSLLIGSLIGLAAGAVSGSMGTGFTVGGCLSGLGLLAALITKRCMR